MTIIDIFKSIKTKAFVLKKIEEKKYPIVFNDTDGIDDIYFVNAVIRDVFREYKDLIVKGMSYKEDEEYEKSEKCFLKALEVAKKMYMGGHNDFQDYSLCACQYQLGHALYQLKDFKRAYKYYKKSLPYLNKHLNGHGSDFIIEAICVYTNMYEISHNKKYLNRAYEISSDFYRNNTLSLGQYYLFFDILWRLGKFYSEKEDYLRSARYFEKCKEISFEAINLYGIKTGSILKHTLAAHLFHADKIAMLKDYTTAKKELSEVIRLRRNNSEVKDSQIPEIMEITWATMAAIDEIVTDKAVANF